MIATSHEPTAPAFAIDIRLARMDDIYPILGLHREAFADKFGAAFGAQGAARGIEAMAEAWRRQGVSALRGMFVATHEGHVIGTISLRTWEMSGESSAAAELAFHKILGIWGAMRSIFALSLLDHQIDRNEGYITDVAVLSPFRGRGVASALLSRAEVEARTRNKQFLGLYVSSTNIGARRLYERFGYQPYRTRRSLLAGLILQQRVWLYMRKNLT